MNDENQLVFDEIVAPIVPLIAQEAQNRPRDAATYTLSFQPFTLNLLFALIKGINSISLLVTETKTSTEAKTLDLVMASKSMYSEAFHRYRAHTYRVVSWDNHNRAVEDAGPCRILDIEPKTALKPSSNGYWGPAIILAHHPKWEGGQAVELGVE